MLAIHYFNTYFLNIFYYHDLPNLYDIHIFWLDFVNLKNVCLIMRYNTPKKYMIL